MAAPAAAGAIPGMIVPVQLLFSTNPVRSQGFQLGVKFAFMLGSRPNASSSHQGDRWPGGRWGAGFQRNRWASRDLGSSHGALSTSLLQPLPQKAINPPAETGHQPAGSSPICPSKRRDRRSSSAHTGPAPAARSRAGQAGATKARLPDRERCDRASVAKRPAARVGRVAVGPPGNCRIGPVRSSTARIHHRGEARCHRLPVKAASNRVGRRSRTLCSFQLASPSPSASVAPLRPGCSLFSARSDGGHRRAEGLVAQPSSAAPAGCIQPIRPRPMLQNPDRQTHPPSQQVN